MAYRLEDFPLRFDNAKSLATQEKVENVVGWVLLTLVIGSCLFLDALIVFGHTKQTPVWGVVVAALSPWLLFGIVGGFLWLMGRSASNTDRSGLLPTEPSTLVLDDEGVRLTIGKHQQNYPWTGISSAYVRETSPKGQSKVRLRAVHLRLKGQFTAGYYDDWIGGVFGIDVDALQALIQQGIERWGNPSPDGPAA